MVIENFDMKQQAQMIFMDIQVKFDVVDESHPQTNTDQLQIPLHYF